MALSPKRRTTASAEKETAAEATASGLPLFYKQPAVIDKNRHAAASVSPQQDYSFARGTNSLPINGIEFMEAVKSYPIVFTNGDASLPIVLVGLEKENYFVTDDGIWLANHYIPAYARQYPFVLLEKPVADKPDEKQMFLCIDEASSQFQANGRDGAEPLYDTEGNVTEFANNAVKFCGAVLEHHLITRNFTADLKKHNLLTPNQARIELKSGKTITLGDFLVIDEKAFNELSSEIFLEFRTKGWLPLIYLALVSQSNWKNLVQLARQ